MTFLLLLTVVIFAQIVETPLDTPTPSQEIENQEKLTSTGTATTRDDPSADHPSADQPSIDHLQIEKPSHDFGTVYLSQTLKHEFTIVNWSESEIQITEIKTDCGCMVSVPENKKLMPEEKISIGVTYQPEFETGKVAKTVTVYTDIASENNWFELIVLADIQSLLEVTPAQVYFKNVHFGEEVTEEVMIRAREGENVNITKVEMLEGRLDLNLSPVSNDGVDDSDSDITSAENKSAEWKLELSLPPDTPTGKFSAKVRLETNAPMQPYYILEALAFVQSSVSIRPTQCYWGTISPGEEKTRSFRVRTSGDHILETPVVHTELPDHTWQVETQEEGKSYIVKMTLNVPLDFKGKISGDFKVTTNDPTQPDLHVPVFGYVPSEKGTTGPKAKESLEPVTTPSDPTESSD